MQRPPADLRLQFENEVLERAVIGAQIVCLLVIVLAPLFGLLDLQMYPDRARPMFAVRIAITAVTAGWLGLILWLGHHGRAVAWIRPIGWAILVAPVLGLDGIILMAGGGESPYYAGLCLVLLGLFVMMPWGLVEMGAQGMLIWIQYLFVMQAFGPEIEDTRLFVANNTFMASMVLIGLTWTYFARDLRVKEFLGRVRLAQKEAARAKEARVSGALARAGRELIASIHTPDLLDRLCASSASLLGCDVSQTWLWRAADAAYEPVASHGERPESWETLRLVKLPPDRIAGLLRRLEAEGVVEMQATHPEDSLPIAEQGLAHMLVLGLRRGEELIGCQVMGYRTRTERLSDEEVRIATGIAQLASLALEHARTLDELARANEVKAHFVAVLSHELRNPITAIGGLHLVLLDGAAGPLSEEQAELLQSAQQRTTELNQLIIATLDLSRFEADHVRLDLEEIDVAALVDELARQTRVPASKPDLQLCWEAAPGLPRVETDRFKLKMVLTNLVGNALKYSERGQVVLRADEHNGGVGFRVSDTGVGIPGEALPVIFEPFRQLGDKRQQRRDGVGLGLHIVRRLVDALGGTIEVDSEVGRGSTFFVWLPARRTPPSAEPAGEGSREAAPRLIYP